MSAVCPPRPPIIEGKRGGHRRYRPLGGRLEYHGGRDVGPPWWFQTRRRLLPRVRLHVLAYGSDRGDHVDEHTAGVGHDEVPLPEVLAAQLERGRQPAVDDEAPPLGVH